MVHEKFKEENEINLDPKEKEVKSKPTFEAVLLIFSQPIFMLSIVPIGN